MDDLDRQLQRIRSQCGSGSPASWTASLPPALRDLWLATIPETDAARLEYEWPFWARRDQLPPEGAWRFWLFRGGRGGGKTRAGAEAIRTAIERGQSRRVAL